MKKAFNGLLCVSFLISAIILMSAGCGKKVDAKKEDVKGSDTKKADLKKADTKNAVSEIGLEPTRLENKSSQKSDPSLFKISDNPQFFDQQEIQSQSDAAKDLDSFIKPILKELFDDAKLIGVDKDITAPTKDDVVLGSLHYAVRRLLDIPAGDELHKALLANKFSASPRLGREPQHGHVFVMMSVFFRTSKGLYSLVFTLNTKEQTIVVKSYQLGSKYDRM